jgi:hypothetical protein
MGRKQLQAKDATEALIMEQAKLFARELRRTCHAAPDGHVLDQAESLILKQGRDFLRLALQASLQEQAQEAEKKGRRPERAPASGGVTTKGNGHAKS